MSANLYNGQIVDRVCTIFTEGNVPLLDKIYSENTESPMDIFRRAILNGKSKMIDNLLLIRTDDVWVVIHPDGKIEIGEGAA